MTLVGTMHLFTSSYSILDVDDNLNLNPLHKVGTASASFQRAGKFDIYISVYDDA